jgi:uncharacterized protein
LIIGGCSRPANAELGFQSGDSLAQAVSSKEAGIDKLRGVAALYPAYIQIVANKESGIKTLADLKGKRFSAGPEKSTLIGTATALLKGAGLTLGDLARVDYAGFAEGGRMVVEGALDADVVSSGLGMESVRHQLASGETTLVSIPPEVIAKAGPAYVPGTIPAGTYDGQPGAVPTAMIMTLLVTREGVSDDVVYLMTKLLFDHLDLLAQTHPAAKGIDPAKAPFGVLIPLHPGAERYYREIGLVK